MSGPREEQFPAKFLRKLFDANDFTTRRHRKKLPRRLERQLVARQRREFWARRPDRYKLLGLMLSNQAKRLEELRANPDEMWDPKTLWPRTYEGKTSK